MRKLDAQRVVNRLYEFEGETHYPRCYPVTERNKKAYHLSLCPELEASVNAHRDHLQALRDSQTESLPHVRKGRVSASLALHDLILRGLLKTTE